MGVPVEQAAKLSLERIEEFLEGSEPLEIRLASRRERYELVSGVLARQRYSGMCRGGKGLVRSYQGKLTGYGTAQLSRLIAAQRGAAAAGVLAALLPALYSCSARSCLTSAHAHSWIGMRGFSSSMLLIPPVPEYTRRRCATVWSDTNLGASGMRLRRGSSRPVSKVGNGLELNRLRRGFTLEKLTYGSPSCFNGLEEHELRLDRPLAARVACFQRDEEYYS